MFGVSFDALHGIPKPPLPYTKGAILTVHPHNAPPPTPVTWDCCCMDDSGMEERKNVALIDRCLRHPPLPGRTDASTLDLEIIDLLQVGDLKGSQVFTVRLSSTGKKAVAKVFDPLYYDDDDGYLDPFHITNQQYTHEVRAYTVLSEFQGTLIPEFYGSYTFDINCPGFQNQRAVRLVLLEYIPGQSMQQLQPSDYDQQRRKHIMKTIIDFESSAYKNDIDLKDLAPRNVILLPRELNTTRDIVCLDFEDAIFGRLLNVPEVVGENIFLGQYISPLLRWRKKDITRKFGDWIDWEWSSWVETEWAYTAGSITDEMREAIWWKS